MTRQHVPNAAGLTHRCLQRIARRTENTEGDVHSLALQDSCGRLGGCHLGHAPFSSLQTWRSFVGPWLAMSSAHCQSLMETVSIFGEVLNIYFCSFLYQNNKYRDIFRVLESTLRCRLRGQRMPCPTQTWTVKCEFVPESAPRERKSFRESGIGIVLDRATRCRAACNTRERPHTTGAGCGTSWLVSRGQVHEFSPAAGLIRNTRVTSFFGRCPGYSRV